MGWRVLASDLDAHRSVVIVQIRDQNLLDELIKMVVFFNYSFQFASKRTDQTIGKKNAQKSADQRAADEFSQHLWRLVDLTHGFDNA